MHFNFDLINIFVLTVVILNFFLGTLIFLTKKNNKINQSFFVFLIAAMFWGVSMFFYRGVESLELSTLFARILYVSAALIPFSFLFFIKVFPEDKYNLPEKYYVLLFIPFILTVLFSILQDKLIYTVSIVGGKEKTINFDFLYHTLYALYIISYFSICYILLIIKFFKFKDTKKKQIKYVIYGTFISTIIGVCTNLIMPYLNDFSLNWMGQVGIIVMISYISYSILKDRLFDIKVAATQLIVFVLCVGLLVRVFLSSNKSDFIVSTAFLLVTVVVGIFLVRSVIHEVTQREKIEKLADELKLVNEGQTSMIHFMNHQIKGRFGVAKNIFAELLSEDYGKMPPDTRPLIEKGLEETNTGINYVQSILKGATAENGSLQYDKQPMDLKNLVEEAVNGQKDKAEAKGLKFDLSVKDGDYSFTGDALQLGEAVRNLIDNSINYTLTGSILMKLENKEESFVFEVIDTGVGITPEDMGNLFKAGGRGANSLKVNVNSTGYGLVFVKNVVEAHGGKVWVESRGEGKGSSFYIELPKTK